jgi:hypothetical protein
MGYVVLAIYVVLALMLAVIGVICAWLIPP